MRSLIGRLMLGLGLTGAIYLATRGTVEYPLESGVLYAVATDANRAQVDLPFAEAGAQYLLVVSNQAHDTAARRIEIEVEPCAAPSAATLRRVAPLVPAPVTAEIPAPAPRQVQRAPATRSFWLRDGAISAETAAAETPIVTKLAGEGTHVRVWADVTSRVPEATIGAIVENFERSVLPLAERYLGLPEDVDGDGCFGIVITGQLSRLAGGRVALGGMVNAADFATEEDDPRANRADVLYLNADLPPGRHLETVLAHEFAHAVTASGRWQRRPLLFAARYEEAWLNEAIAHVAENLHSDNWSNLDHRVAQFLAQPDATPLVVADYREAGLWRSPAARGSTYLFLRWCVEHYGPGLLPALIYSDRSGVANLEAATGEPFAELYRRYAAELFLAAIEDAPAHTINMTTLPRVDLAGRLGERELAGPHFERWDLPEGAAQLPAVEVVGTGSKYLVISADQPGMHRLRVHAESGASLQVTLVRLRRPLPRLELTAGRQRDGSWQLALDASDNFDVAKMRVGWESLGNNAARGSGVAAITPAGANLGTCFDLSQMSAGVLTSRALELGHLPRGPVAVHVIGYDKQGRRASAWTTIDLGASPVHMASAVDDVRRR